MDMENPSKVTLQCPPQPKYCLPDPSPTTPKMIQDQIQQVTSGIGPILSPCHQQDDRNTKHPIVFTLLYLHGFCKLLQNTTYFFMANCIMVYIIQNT